jgi:hypothetical protein
MIIQEDNYQCHPKEFKARKYNLKRHWPVNFPPNPHPNILLNTVNIHLFCQTSLNKAGNIIGPHGTHYSVY